MTATAAARSTLVTSLLRYSRSWGLGLLLLAGPVGARFMVARDDGSGVQITVGHHLPVMTSAMLGVSLGIVVSTLLLPIGFLYLRSNVTRRQPWQIEEVTAASRMAIALGRFGADVAILFAMLASLIVAGWFLGWLIVSGPFDIGQISWTLWLVAAPALIGLAAIHRLLDARPLLRRGAGDALFFCLWLASLAVPALVADRASSFSSNLTDFAGYVRPLMGPTPLKGQDFTIGNAGRVAPGRVPLDVMAGVHAPGYIPSRIAWVGIAVMIAIFAGLLYRPHRAAQRRRRRMMEAVDRWLAPKALPMIDADAPPAGFVAAPFFGLVVGEFRLIGAGRLFKLLAIIAVCAGLVADYRHIGSPAALLLLVFGLVAHAGRSEAKGLLSLTHTALLGPWMRRIAFVAAGTGWALLLALPAALVRISPEPLLFTGAAGAAAALVAIGLATMSHSAFAPRLVLLVLWYAYLSS
ncbi:MAG: hypothetical protein ABW023_06380 [Sphingomonas sp.]